MHPTSARKFAGTDALIGPANFFVFIGFKQTPAVYLTTVFGGSKYRRTVLVLGSYTTCISSEAFRNWAGTIVLPFCMNAACSIKTACPFTFARLLPMVRVTFFPGACPCTAFLLGTQTTIPPALSNTCLNGTNALPFLTIGGTSTGMGLSCRTSAKPLFLALLVRNGGFERGVLSAGLAYFFASSGCVDATRPAPSTFFGGEASGLTWVGLSSGWGRSGTLASSFGDGRLYAGADSEGSLVAVTRGF